SGGAQAELCLGLVRGGEAQHRQDGAKAEFQRTEFGHWWLLATKGELPSEVSAAEAALCRTETSPAAHQADFRQHQSISPEVPVRPRGQRVLPRPGRGRFQSPPVRGDLGTFTLGSLYPVVKGEVQGGRSSGGK